MSLKLFPINYFQMSPAKYADMLITFKSVHFKGVVRLQGKWIFHRCNFKRTHLHFSGPFHVIGLNSATYRSACETKENYGKDINFSTLQWPINHWNRTKISDITTLFVHIFDMTFKTFSTLLHIYADCALISVCACVSFFSLFHIKWKFK